MEAVTWALILMVGMLGCLGLFVSFQASKRSKAAWMPEDSEIDKHKITAVALLHDAHQLYVRAKQENDFFDALINSSYGLALVRAVHAVVNLDDVKGLHLPKQINGATGLLKSLCIQHSTLLKEIKIQRESKPVKLKTSTGPITVQDRESHRVIHEKLEVNRDNDLYVKLS
jgi:hypothetical protein